MTVQREVKSAHWSLKAFPVLRPPPFRQPDEGWRPFELGLRVRTVAVRLQERKLLVDRLAGNGHAGGCHRAGGVPDVAKDRRGSC